MLQYGAETWRKDGDDAQAVTTADICAVRADRIMAAADPIASRHALIAVEICGLDEEIASSPGQESSLLSSAAWQLLSKFECESFLSFSEHGNLLIFIPNIDNLFDTARLAQDLLAEPLSFEGAGAHEPSFSLRAGMSASPHHGTDFRTLVANAELALYDLRRRGQCGLLFYEPHYRRAAAERQTLRHELRAAERERQFVLHYQPQIDLKTGYLVGVEALLRWRHPKLGLIGPQHFIETLETLPVATRVGQWVIEEAVRQVALWRADGHAIRTAINIFPAQLNETLVETIAAALFAQDLPAGLLEVEITERLQCEQMANAKAVIGGLRQLGIGVALDDFGTGFATLNAIRSFDVSRLKIDKSFVAGMMDSRRDAAIVSGLLDLGRETGISVIAEGIERHEQLMALTVNGCDEGQGALFGMPMEPQLISAIIAEGVMPIATTYTARLLG